MSWLLSVIVTAMLLTPFYAWAPAFIGWIGMACIAIPVVLALNRLFRGVIHAHRSVR